MPKALKHFLPSCLFAALCIVQAVSAQTPNADTNLPIPQAIQSNNIENFFQLTDKVYSGSSPEKEEMFAELQKRGIKTIISVDGAKPHVEAAKKFGLRYVHLPIGYDGVPTNRVAELVKSAAILPGPFYVHCHHGKHRGPAGAALICMGAEGWTAKQAVSWLHQAGTATNYVGLYKTVEQFQRPSARELEQIPNELPEQAIVAPLVDAMVQIDEHFDHLKLLQATDFKPTPAHPDLSTRHEALLLHELFKELLRSPEMKKHDKDFILKMEEVTKAAGDFHSLLLQPETSKERFTAVFQQIGGTCASCHKTHRN